MNLLGLSLFLLLSLEDSPADGMPVLSDSRDEAKAALVQPVPDFAQFTDVREKKDAFFSFLEPMVHQVNNEIRTDRLLVEESLRQFRIDGLLEESLEARVRPLLRRYRLSEPDLSETLLTNLLDRVDTIPASLALAQAANESGWGTSRFARQANNFFGVWCFTEGCGVKPASRAPDATHEVARYDDATDSIRAYMHTINTHAAYASLRTIRSAQRQQQLSPTGNALAEGLLLYSALGEDYVRAIQALIRSNPQLTEA